MVRAAAPNGAWLGGLPPVPAPGEQRVKNIARPVRVHRILLGEGHDRSEPAAVTTANPPLSLPDKPSIAVLPFQIASLAGGPRPASAPSWLSSIPANETAVFETRNPELIPIRRIPGLRNAIEPLNRIIRIRADAAGGFEDSACGPDHSVAFLHGFAALTQNLPANDLRWADGSLYVLDA